MLLLRDAGHPTEMAVAHDAHHRANDVVATHEDLTAPTSSAQRPG
jgi:hypothetical protein